MIDQNITGQCISLPGMHKAASEPILNLALSSPVSAQEHIIGCSKPKCSYSVKEIQFPDKCPEASA